MKVKLTDIDVLSDDSIISLKKVISKFEIGKKYKVQYGILSENGTSFDVETSVSFSNKELIESNVMYLIGLINGVIMADSSITEKDLKVKLKKEIIIQEV